MSEALERRVLVLAPTAKDAALVQSVLERAGLACLCCPDLTRLCTELRSGAAAVMIPEEIVAQDGQAELARFLARQPPWSDLPVLILARAGADSAAIARAMTLLGNVTVLERPMRVAALVSAARTALRARRRQYQIREHLAERQRDEEALRDEHRRKDEFLAMLAHELRNPLAPISSALHVLERTSGGDARLERLTEMMARQVKHLVRLVDDLLEVSRITGGKIELRKDLVDVAAVIDTAVEASRPLIDAAGHRLLVALPPQPLTVDADPVRLAQVFANLLNNAAKYTDPGGRISVAVRRDDAEAAISVSDTGTGIAPEMLGRVFDLFAQGPHQGNRAQGGLGIGLTLVKSIVEMHGGTVSASSAGADKGSEFLVRLPLAPAERAARAHAQREAVVLPPRRILVVDDNRDAADSLAGLLRVLGAEVQVAYSGREALEALETYRPAAVLLDIGMPDMDGHEVARRVRQRPAFRDLTLIALTGWGQKEDLRRTLDAGFDYHLTKPADVATLGALFLNLEKTAASPPGAAPS